MQRLIGWVRTLSKLVLLVLVYVWLGAAYKMFYAQTHDLSRFKNDRFTATPLSFYQRQFLLESQLHQTWMFGPAFQTYIGSSPSYGLSQDDLKDYARARAPVLAALPARYPSSLFAGYALADAWQLQKIADAPDSFIFTKQFKTPHWAWAVRNEHGQWSAEGEGNPGAAQTLARRLANEYPDNPQAPAALLEGGSNSTSGAVGALRRVLSSYPQSEEAATSAGELSFIAKEIDDPVAARELKQRSLNIMEALGRERYGRLLPPDMQMNILNARIDLAEIELLLQHRQEARGITETASQELQQLKAPPATSAAPLYNPFRDNITAYIPATEQRLQQVINDLWVNDLYHDLKVPVSVPGSQPPSYPVEGVIRLQGKAFPGIQVVLIKIKAQETMRRKLRSNWWIRNSPYRATTGSLGQYSIREVPAGEYTVGLRYPVQPAAAHRTAIAPVGPALGVFSVRGPTKVPTLRFEKAMETVSRGELRENGNTVRLRWKAWPRASAYRVEVTTQSYAVWARLSPAQRVALRMASSDAVTIWRAPKVSRSYVDCPLAALLPGDKGYLQSIRYSYAVTALDAKGRTLATSAQPLGEFALASSAISKLRKLNFPPLQPPTVPPGIMLRPGGRP